MQCRSTALGPPLQRDQGGLEDSTPEATVKEMVYRCFSLIKPCCGQNCAPCFVNKPSLGVSISLVPLGALAQSLEVAKVSEGVTPPHPLGLGSGNWKTQQNEPGGVTLESRYS